MPHGPSKLPVHGALFGGLLEDPGRIQWTSLAHEEACAAPRLVYMHRGAGLHDRCKGCTAAHRRVDETGRRKAEQIAPAPASEAGAERSRHLRHRTMLVCVGGRLKTITRQGIPVISLRPNGGGSAPAPPLGSPLTRRRARAQVPRGRRRRRPGRPQCHVPPLEQTRCRGRRQSPPWSPRAPGSSAQCAPRGPCR